MENGDQRHTPRNWTRRAATGDRLAFRHPEFAVEALPTTLERPGLSLGTGWEITVQRQGDVGRGHVVARATTREEAADAVFETMRRINRTGRATATRGTAGGDGPRSAVDRTGSPPERTRGEAY